MEGMQLLDKFKCRLCGNWVFPIRTDEGDEVQLDAEPSLYGTVAIVKERAVVLSGIHLEVFRAHSVPLFVPHSATCHKR